MAEVSEKFVSTEQFVRDVEREVRRGFSVIPLVGSGLSAPSGVLTGEAFGEYLLCCVWDALRDIGDSDRDSDKRGIDLENGIWAPPPYSETEIKTAKEWVRVRASRLYLESGGALPVEQEAIGALADWRSTLLFLSRLRRPDPSSKYCQLAAPDSYVVDSFNHYITRGHTPNLGHQMLAFLTRLLRIRTVLTTNFDSLLEKAFAEAHFPIEVFDVHLSGHLPHQDLVRSQLSLVKLHGSRFETRADYSLDGDPSHEDQQSFQAYFSAEKHSPPAHLLVLGFSGRDKRVISFIRNMVAKLKDQPVAVFWVCHRETEIEHVRSSLGKDLPPRNLVITSGRADLLLFSLYHRFVTTIPPAGSNFEYSQYIPPDAVSFFSDPDQWAKKLARAIADGKALGVNCPTARLRIESKAGDEPGVIYSLDGAPGISDLAQSCYSHLLEMGRPVLWFELDDFCNPADLAACIMQSVAAQRGQLDLDVITLAISSSDPNPRHVAEHFGIQERQWVLFLYGRQSAGTSAGWTNEAWKDVGEKEAEESDFVELWRLLRVLSRIGFTVVYMPLSEACHAAIATSVDVSLKTASNPAKAAESSAGLLRTFVRDPEFKKGKTWSREEFLPRNAAEILAGVRSWIHSGGSGGNSVTERSRFLFVMTLFRQSRNLSALCSEAAYPDQHRFNTEGIDNDEERLKHVEPWITRLTEIGLLRRKAGGFFWMHRDLRETLRFLLEDKAGWSEPKDALEPKRSRLHHWLAEWYLHAYRATGNFTPFVESAYHRLECLRHLERADIPEHLVSHYQDENIASEAREEDATIAYRRALCTIAIGEAIKLFDSGRRKPVLNLEDDQRDALFGKLPNLKDVAERHGCGELWNELVLSASRLHTLSSTQSRGALSYQEAQVAPDLTAHLQAVELQYNQIKREVVFERFSATRGKLIHLAGHLGYELTEEPRPMDVEKTTVKAILGRYSSPQWRLIIKVVRRLAHTYIKETALGFHLAELERFGQSLGLSSNSFNSAATEARLAKARENAAIASALLLSADRSGAFLDAASRDSQIIGSVACQSLHGLALGYLGRFREAQRKLDEATGSLTASSLARDPLERAILELRRAAIFLLQAQALKSDSAVLRSPVLDPADVPRATIASIHDAWGCLERARNLLTGDSRIVSWWARLYTNQLRALALYRQLAESPENDGGAIFPEVEEVAHRGALLLWPRRATVSVRACFYHVQASPRGERAKVARQCHETLNRELEQFERKPANEQPDPVVAQYLVTATHVLAALERHNA